MIGDEKNIKKAKGVKKSVVNKEIKDALFKAKQLGHGMETIRSERHEVYSMYINKISLSPFDSKRWIDEDGIHTKAYGYKEEEEELEEELEEMEEEYTEEELAEMEEELEQMEAELAELEEYTEEEMEAELSEFLGW